MFKDQCYNLYMGAFGTISIFITIYMAFCIDDLKNLKYLSPLLFILILLNNIAVQFMVISMFEKNHVETKKKLYNIINKYNLKTFKLTEKQIIRKFLDEIKGLDIIIPDLYFINMSLATSDKTTLDSVNNSVKFLIIQYDMFNKKYNPHRKYFSDVNTIAYPFFKIPDHWKPNVLHDANIYLSKKEFTTYFRCGDMMCI